MGIYHSREDLQREVAQMPDGMFRDGVLVDCPKRRRREQALGAGMVRISWPKEQKKRFAAQYNRFVEMCTKDIGIELLLRRLESLSDEDLRREAEEGA